ncbi:outer membrane lipoprotein-sorting protein [Paraburkholderia diazotrophica]|uniref:ABC-type transport system, involved in lipoprotein release, permease component n=1 Tax=Paraburkholderia diazotrophica TaxID=667676 RepID=A0A1H6WZI4_9BURK|nr:outer membrane lipoprotein-sorting protein [Paraburkholderia diazotrophica]SEJ19747.1 ABC-type transport system, involved in lipoprotein release, permease component [Paraburkholderia diazotrophica]
MLGLAAKNLRRDRRRTVATIVTMTVGMLAILVFLAWVEFVERSLAQVVIEDQANGHIQIYRKDGPINLSAFPAQYSISRDDQYLVSRLVREISAVRNVSYDMTGVGMVQHGTRSSIFLATGVEPTTGQGQLNDADRVRLTAQLADLIGARRGADIQLVGATYGNRMNAVDATFADEFSTGTEATEDKGLKMPLSLMQSLYDTDSVSRVIVRIGDRVDTDRIRDAIAAGLEQRAPGRFEVTTWSSPQVGQLYTSFMGFFKMLFLFTGTVIALIAGTTVQHAVRMNFDDRIKEIATMRAIGFSRTRLMLLFAHETLFCAAFSAMLAIALTGCLFALLDVLHVTTTLPRVALPVPLSLEIPWTHSVGVVGLSVALVVASGAFTAARCMRRTMGAARGKLARDRSLARALMGGAVAVACALLVPAGETRAAEPDTATMTRWLNRADIARGGIGTWSWTVRVHSSEPSGGTDTTYAVAVRDGDALVRTIEPKRYQNERILIASRTMWYTKPGLRRPISVSPQQRLVGEASNGDIAATQYARDYTPEYAGETRVEGHDCYRLRLNATRNDVTYAGIVYYVDRRTLLGVKAEFMTPSGEVFKTATFDYQTLRDADGKESPFVSAMTIVNTNFPDRMSRLEYSEVQPASFPASLFSLSNFTSM